MARTTAPAKRLIGELRYLDTVETQKIYAYVLQAAANAGWVVLAISWKLCASDRSQPRDPGYGMNEGPAHPHYHLTIKRRESEQS